MSQKLNSKAIAGILLAAGLFCSSAADATTSLSTPLTVSATVVTLCVAGIGTPISIASLTSTSGLTGTGAVTVVCTAGSGYDVKLDQGLNSGGSADPTQRKMKNALSAATLTYGLYQDAAYSTPWGQTTGSNTMHKSGTGLVDTWPVYIKVDSTSAQTAPAGVYSDVVQLSVDY
jgi:spore coat protein U-like protein